MTRIDWLTLTIALAAGWCSVASVFQRTRHMRQHHDGGSSRKPGRHYRRPDSHIGGDR